MVVANQKAKNPSALGLPFVIKVAIPDDQVGVIIGKQGATHKGIQERCRAQIVVPMTPDKDDPEVYHHFTFNPIESINRCITY